MKNLKLVFLGILSFLTIALIIFFNPQKARGLPFENAYNETYYIIQPETECSYPNCIDNLSPIIIRGEITAKDPDRVPQETHGKIKVIINLKTVAEVDNNDGFEVTVDPSDFKVGLNNLVVKWRTPGTAWFAKILEYDFVVRDECGVERGSLANTGDSTCGPVSPLNVESWSLCAQTRTENNPDAILKCAKCLNNDNGVWTAVGCIPTDPTNMIAVIIKIGLLIGGGVATLIILAGSFMLSVSQGDPQKTSEAKEMITAAVIGLIFIIFSVSILQLIGVQILQLPEFGQ